MDLHHRNANFLVLPDYFSPTGVDMCIDEMTRQYLTRTINIRKRYPPVTGRMGPENMLGYRAPCVCSDLRREDTCVGTNVATGASVGLDVAPVITSTCLYNSGGYHFCLQTVPILTGFLAESE